MNKHYIVIDSELELFIINHPGTGEELSKLIQSMLREKDVTVDVEYNKYSTEFNSTVMENIKKAEHVALLLTQATYTLSISS